MGQLIEDSTHWTRVKSVVVGGCGKLINDSPRWVSVKMRAKKMASCSIDTGFTYLKEKDYRKARFAFEKAIRFDSQNAMAHYNLGCLFDELGLVDWAVASYLKATELDPKYSDAFYNLALLCEDACRFWDAITYWHRVSIISSGEDRECALRRLKPLRARFTHLD